MSADRLSRRQLEVLSLVGDGMSYSEIAAHLGIARATVITHVRAIDKEIKQHGATGPTPYVRVMRWALTKAA